MHLCSKTSILIISLFFCGTLSSVVDGYLGDLLCVRMCFNESNAWSPILTGVGVDGVALATNGSMHMTGCLKLSACKASGWTLLQQNSPPNPYSVAYIFDTAGNTAVNTFVDTLTGTGPAPKISVVGTVGTGTPPTLSVQCIQVYQDGVTPVCSTSGVASVLHSVYFLIAVCVAWWMI